MKIAAITVLFLAVVAAAPCDLTKFAPIMSDASFTKCTSDSGFSITAIPSADVVAKMCKSDACQSLVGKVAAVGEGDCTMSNGKKLETDLLKPIQVACASNAGPAPTTSAPATTPTAPTATSAAPTAAPQATEAPGANKTSSSSASSSGAVEVGQSSSNGTEAATSPVPASTEPKTPKPTSAAASVAMASSAVVLAVVAALQ